MFNGPSATLVASLGSIILLEAGDRVPADARIMDEFGLHTQESSLTGESNPIAKQADIELLPNTSLAERTNCLFAGTSVVSGKATAMVVTTGMDTEIGGIARLLQATVNEQTPLQRRLAELGKVLVGICLSLGVFSNPFLVLAMIGSLAVQLVAIACPWSASILGLHAMPWSDLPFILFLSLIPVTLVELRKMLSVKKGVPI